MASSTCNSVMKPKRPMLMPTIGMAAGPVKFAALSIVPSPPTVITRSVLSALGKRDSRFSAGDIQLFSERFRSWRMAVLRSNASGTLAL